MRARPSCSAFVSVCVSVRARVSLSPWWLTFGISRSTYNHISSWLTDARNLTGPNTVIVLIGALPVLLLHCAVPGGVGAPVRV